ncbi:MAG: DUF1761 domain-containing protein [Candidatus Paceibacterota bacterium]|jgi:hypothetical protein
MNFAVNLWSVVLAVVASSVVMAIWYGPLFGKQWMVLMGFDDSHKAEMKKRMGKAWGIAIVSAFVEAYVLAQLLQLANLTDASGAIQFTFMLWLGFVAAIGTSEVSWEGKSWKLYGINVGYCLVSMLVMSLVLLWK